MSKVASQRYSISFKGGTCGHFIAMLVIYSLSNRTDDIVYESTGGCHTPYYQWFEDNVEAPGDGVYKNMEIYTTCKLKDTSPFDFLVQPMPFIFESLDTMASINPNFKHIVITCNTADLLRAEVNYFYKRHAPSSVNSEFFETFELVKNDNAILNKNANNLLELFPSELKHVLESHLNRTHTIRGEITRYIPSECLFVDNHYSIPEQYKNNIFLINFNDIMNNKTAVLEKINTITGITTTADLERQYDNYLALQTQLDSKIPL